MKIFYTILAVFALSTAHANLSFGNPALGEDPHQGHAIAVWVVDQNGMGVIQTSTYDNNSETWSEAQDLSSPLHDASNPHVSKDPYGDAVVVWQVLVDGVTHIEAAFFNSAIGAWSDPSMLSLPVDNAINPKVSKDVSGITIAVWETTDEVHHTIEASIYVPDFKNWSSPMLISDEDYHSFDPQVSVDTQGNGITLFRRANGSESIIQSATYTNTTHNWSKAKDVSKSDNYATTPQIGTDSSGRAFAVVHPQGDSHYTIMIHAPQPQEKIREVSVPTYIDVERIIEISSPPAPVTEPFIAPLIPTNFKTQLHKNVFPTQIEWFTVLTWDAPDNSSVTAYRLYLNGELIATVAATSPLSHEMHNINVDGTYLFELSSINADDEESAKLILNLF